MKQFLFTSFSIALGIVLGTWVVAGQNVTAPDGSFNKLEAKEIVLIDDAGNPLARLGTEGNRVSLVFLDSEKQPAVEIGTQPDENTRYLTFYGQDYARVLASLSSGPDGRSTLTLGDEGWENRVILGALSEDMVGRPLDGFGLLLPNFEHPIGPPMFSVEVLESEGKMDALMRLMQSDGTYWTVR